MWPIVGSIALRRLILALRPRVMPRLWPERKSSVNGSLIDDGWLDAFELKSVMAYLYLLVEILPEINQQDTPSSFPRHTPNLTITR